MWGEIFHKISERDDENEGKYPLPNDIDPEHRASLLKKLSQKLKYTLFGVFNPKHEEMVEKEIRADLEKKNKENNKNDEL